MNSRFLTVFLVFSVTLPACAPSAPEPAEREAATPVATSAAKSEPLPLGTVWTWTAVTGTEARTIDEPDRYTLEWVEETRYHAQADCNLVRGPVERVGGGIRLAAGPMTLAACGPDSLDQEFVRLLGGVRDFSRQGDRLTLELDDAAGTMEFVAMRHRELVGTAWKVRSYDNGKRAVVSTTRGTTLEANFGPDGRLTGSAGCNGFSAGYELDGASMRIGPAAATKRACPGDGVMQQEAQFLAALGKVATWEIRGNRLQLRTAEGSLALDLFAGD